MPQAHPQRYTRKSPTKYYSHPLPIPQRVLFFHFHQADLKFNLILNCLRHAFLILHQRQRCIIQERLRQTPTFRVVAHASFPPFTSAPVSARPRLSSRWRELAQGSTSSE